MRSIEVGKFFEIVKDDKVKIIAGKGGLKRKANSVGVVNLINPYKWIKDGEIILITFSLFKEKEMEFIQKLYERGCACLFIHPGEQKNFSLPNCVLNLANNLDFPIFVLPQEVAYTLIFDRFYGAVLDKEEKLLDKFEEINYEMTEILIKNKGLNDMLFKAQKILKKNILYLDENLKPLEKYSKSHLLNYKDIILNNLKNQNEEFEDIEIKEITLETNMIFKYVIIKLKNNINNYLLMLESKKISKKEKILDNIVLSNTSATIRFNRLRDLDIIEAKENLKYGFFDDLINKSYKSAEIMMKRAAVLELNLMYWNILLIFDIYNFDKYYQNNSYKGEIHIQEVKQILKYKIKNSIGSYFKNISFFIPKSDGYILIFELKKAEYKNFNYKEFFKKMNQKINRELTNEEIDFSVMVGISEPMNKLEDIPKAYRQAVKAQKIGSKLYNKGKTVFYEDLGVYTFLVNEGVAKEDKNLNKILEYDKTKKGELVNTLEVFLDNNGNINRTAQEIYTHPNTVKYRIKKIKEIVGEDILNNKSKRLYYHVLIKNLKLR